VIAHTGLPHDPGNARAAALVEMMALEKMNLRLPAENGVAA